jgi:hypothetical protein
LQEQSQYNKQRRRVWYERMKGNNMDINQKRKRAALSIEKFAGVDHQYKRKLEKIEQEKQKKKLMEFKRKRLLRKSGFLDEDGNEKDADNALPQFLTSEDLKKGKKLKHISENDENTRKKQKKKKNKRDIFEKSTFESAMKAWEEKKSQLEEQKRQKKKEQKKRKEKIHKRIEKRRKIGLKTAKGQPVMKFKIMDMLNTIKARQEQ